MRKEITVDISDAKNENDVVYRIYKALNWFPGIREEERIERIKLNNHPVSWDAFSDNISGIDSLVDEGITELYLSVKGITKASDIIGKDKFGRSLESILASVLMHRIDPSQRCDNIKFYPQFILE